MLLLGYISGFCALFLLSRKRSENARSLILMGYNYLFVAVMLTLNQVLGQPVTFEGLTETILKSIYASPPSMTFRGSMNSTSGVQQAAILCLVSIYTLRTAFVLFFKKAWNLAQMTWRIHWAKDVYVLWGNRGDAEQLLQDMKKTLRRPAAVYIPFSPDKEVLFGALTGEEKTLRQHKAGKTYHIALLPDKSGGNPNRLSLLNEVCASGKPFRVTAFLEDDLLRLEQLRYSNLDAYLVSTEDLLYRRLPDELHPLALLMRHADGTQRNGVFIPSRAFRLRIVGFSDLGRAFLLSSAEQAAFEAGDERGLGMRAQVYQAGAADWEAFRLDYPALGVYADVERCADLPDAALCGELADPARRPDCIVLSSPDAEANILLARRLVRQMNHLGLDENARPALLVYTGADTDEIPLLESAAEVYPFSDTKALLRCDAVFLRSDDEGAARLHEEYRKSNPDAADWYALDTFTQSSNRAALRDAPNKKQLAQDLQTDREAALWELAKYEHRRWVAFHAAHGWITLPADELTQQEREGFVTKHTAEKRHTCMCPWEELDALPQREPGLIKRYDYENVIDNLKERK